MSETFTRRTVNLGLIGLALSLCSSGSARPLRRITLFDFAVAGGHHHGLDRLRDTLTPGTGLVLQAEPLNPHDADAVVVLHPDGTKLGYVPREANAPVARLLAQGVAVLCEVVGPLDVVCISDIPADLVFTGFSTGDPRLRLMLPGMHASSA